MMCLSEDLFPPHVWSFMSNSSIDFTMPSHKDIFNSFQCDFLFHQLNLPSVANVEQIHTDNVAHVQMENPSGIIFCGQADALITRQKNVALAIRTADCLPISMWSPEINAIGLVHAGWRGTQLLIAQKTVLMMRELWGARLQDVRVIFGPSIQPCCYEVQKEFYNYFSEGLVARDHKLYLDLPSINAHQLMSVGIKKQHIKLNNACTCCDKRFFSYRRQGKSAGRMLSLLMLR